MNNFLLLLLPYGGHEACASISILIKNTNIKKWRSRQCQFRNSMNNFCHSGKNMSCCYTTSLTLCQCQVRIFFYSSHGNANPWKGITSMDFEEFLESIISGRHQCKASEQYLRVKTTHILTRYNHTNLRVAMIL